MTSSIPIETSGEAEVRAKFDALHRASRREPAPSLKARLTALASLRELVSANIGPLTAAISEDFGHRSRHETQLAEFVPLIGGISHARKHLKAWMRPERRATDMTFRPGKSWVRYEPLGVVGILSPWNYPLLLALAPLCDALAAGNRALIKPSEFTPAFSAQLQSLVAHHFPPEQVTVVTGGPDIAEAVTRLPLDHLLFTGSTATGRKVMQAAAANLTPVTLELGGKSPAIVCADYPLEKAARSIAFGKFLNAGQTCIAPDYVLAPAALVRPLADAMIARIKAFYPTIEANPDYTSIISPRHYDRLMGAIEEARAAGANVLTVGEPPAPQSRKLAPTIVIGAPATSLLLREEIFGPILPILPYEDLDSALTTIRGGERPLALYCFSQDAATRARVLDGTISGGVTLNGTLLHIAQHSLPFGGVGASGIGAYHGRDGFRRLSHARAVHQVGAINTFEMLGPPWGRLAGAMIAALRRR
jgi:coniferyl-aldehyde dehydrogenase